MEGKNFDVSDVLELVAGARGCLRSALGEVTKARLELAGVDMGKSEKKSLDLCLESYEDRLGVMIERMGTLCDAYDYIEGIGVE